MTIEPERPSARRRAAAVFEARNHFLGDRADDTPSRQRFRAIHRTLRDRIALLAYPPGMQFDVDGLAQEFEVSRTPIRTVLQRLEYQGLVVTRHGVGTTVAEIDFEGLRDAMQFRMRLAELMGELSPREPGPEALASIAEAAETCRAMGRARDLDRFGRADLKLHDAICSVIGHPLLLQVYDELFFFTVRLWYYFMPRLDWDEEVRVFLADIEATRKAMERGDVRGVGFQVRNALAAALVRLGDLLSEAERGETR